MSRVFKALEQAERDNARREPLISAEAVSERATVVPQWPEPEDEQPPVFTPPPSRFTYGIAGTGVGTGTQALDALSSPARSCDAT